jgi:1-acyl-sn-glycerol-3-phosphate acyltransferase
MTTPLLLYIGYGIAIYVFGMMGLAGGMAVIQEAKIWKPNTLPSLSVLGMLKVLGLNLLWFIGCFIGVGLVICKKVFTFGISDLAKDVNTIVEPVVGGAVLQIFVGQVEVTGMENLPPKDTLPAPIYVANHASQIDVAAVYAIQRRFKWIAKKSVVYLPGVGGVMLFGAHVLIQRSGKNKKSVHSLFEKSQASVESGLPMFFFPQGTRQLAQRLPFKDGAFIVALNSKAPLVPISIDIPKDAWNSMYPLSLLWSSYAPKVRITVHPPIPVTGKESREQLKQACFDKIYSILPDWTAEEKNK